MMPQCITLACSKSLPLHGKHAGSRHAPDTYHWCWVLPLWTPGMVSSHGSLQTSNIVKQCSVVCCAFFWPSTAMLLSQSTQGLWREVCWEWSDLLNVTKHRAPAPKVDVQCGLSYAFRRSELLTRMRPWELRQRREALEKRTVYILIRKISKLSSDLCFVPGSGPKLIFETPAWWVQGSWASHYTVTLRGTGNYSDPVFPNCLFSIFQSASSTIEFTIT